ncbi:MAG: amidohydrolase family protein [Myxococcota bacterium]
MLLFADKVLLGNSVVSNVTIGIDSQGRIEEVTQSSTAPPADIHLKSCLIIPGFINAHSHAFQRLLRGRTQRAQSQITDNFWTWRHVMYRAAAHLDSASIYLASKQAFIEMLLCGTTSVGEFHYIHHRPEGVPYKETATMAQAVFQAALDVGMRICLLRTTYLRGNFGQGPNELQRRFCDSNIDAAWKATEDVAYAVEQIDDSRLTWGVAAHSVRAMTIDDIALLKQKTAKKPFHIHVSETARKCRIA